MIGLENWTQENTVNQNPGLLVYEKKTYIIIFDTTSREDTLFVVQHTPHISRLDFFLWIDGNEVSFFEGKVTVFVGVVVVNRFHVTLTLCSVGKEKTFFRPKLWFHLKH